MKLYVVLGTDCSLSSRNSRVYGVYFYKTMAERTAEHLKNIAYEYNTKETISICEQTIDYYDLLNNVEVDESDLYLD